MTDEEKHTKIMVALAEINTTLIEVVKPAVEQVYINEKCIIKIKSFQSVTKYIGSLISSIVMFIAIRSIWNWIKHH